MITFIIAVLALAVPVRGEYSWDYFADNFATDLAPIIVLFGEQVTKQFLSESTCFLDNIIFAVAPLGVLTAVVSVIRVWGSASLKAFIGRAQEAHGIAEAELCSSTSRDVCELWSNGGISRVFGRPKILEFIYSRSRGNDFYPDFTASREPLCGIYEPKCFFPEETVGVKGATWRESTSGNSFGRASHDGIAFAPHPNLSLNIGIRPFPRLLRVRWLIAAFGVLLQSSFFGYAAWATYSAGYLLNKDQPPQKWAFPFAASGTALLVCGMGLCALLIERSTCERKFKEIDKKSPSARTVMFWLQPGGQSIGDQVFNAFAHWEHRTEYVTSWKPDIAGSARPPLRTFLLLPSILFTVVGFIFQFVGLRGLHASVTLYQLVATLCMAVLRAVLRSKRLDEGKNRLQDRNDSEGHELDWNALQVDSAFEDPKSETPARKGRFWYVVDLLPITSAPEPLKEEKGVVISGNPKGRSIVGFAPPNPAENRPETGINTVDDHHCANAAVNWIRAHEKDDGEKGDEEDQFPNEAARILYYRARLAALTDGPSLPKDQRWDTDIRDMAGKLKDAIQATAVHVFSGEMKLSKDWKDVKALVWSTTCQLDAPLGSPKLRLPIHFLLYLDNGRWTIDKHQLEAALGLWLWSLNNHKDYRFCVKNKIVYAAEQSRKEELKSAIRLWVTQSSPIGEETIRITPQSAAEHSTTPLSTAMFSLSAGVGGNATDLVDWVMLWTAPTVSSLELLAQDLFAMFFNRIAQILEPLTGVEPRSRKRQPATIEISGKPTDQPFLGLTEPNIDIVAEKFIDAGLGSREDALASIVPSLLENNKLPSLADVAQRLLAAARAQRRSSNLQQCEDILQGLLHLGPHDVQASAVRHLGELYRFAVRSKKDSDREFGRKGLKELCSLGDLSDLAQEAQGHYRAVAERFDKGIKVPPTRNQAAYQLNPRLSQPDLESEPTRPFALLLTTDYDIHNAPNGGPAGILKWAIERNCPELIEDLWHRYQTLIAQHIPGSDLTPLFWAVECDSDMETFQALLDWPSAKPEWDDKGNTLLVYATRKHRLDHIRLLLQAGWDVNVQGGRYGNALQAAASLGNDEIVELLLRSGADINAQGGGYDNAVHAAAYWGRANVVKHLLQAGLDVNAPENSIAFRAAVRMLKHNVVTLLIEAGLDVNTSQNGTALQVAVDQDNVEMVDLLLKAGLDAKTHDNGELLLAAVGTENVKMVQLLLQAGLDVNTPSNGKSLHVAVQKGNATVAELLLQARLDVKTHDNGNLLLAAVGQGNVKIVDLLLQAGLDVNTPSNGRALQRAVQRGGDETMVELLLQAKLDVKSHDTGELLTVAAAEDDLGVVDLLLKAGLDINTPENSKVLQAAIRGRNVRIQERLLFQPGINPNAHEPGETLKAAAKQGDERIMELLLQTTVAVNAQEYSEAVVLAAEHGFGKAMELLLEYGTNISGDSETKYGKLLEVAAEAGNEELVARLLEIDPDREVAKEGKHGKALRAAAYGGHEKIVEMLLEAKADVDADEALTVAASEGEESIVKLLLNAEADPDGQDGSPLLDAVYSGNRKIAMLLLQAGADPNFGSQLNSRALHVAAFQGDKRTIKRLLYHGADVNAQGGMYGSALVAAAAGGNEEAVKMLLDRGADVNAQNGKFGSALYAASARNDEAVAELLLKHGADPNARGGQHGHPLIAAATCSSARVVKLLIDSGADVNANLVAQPTPLNAAQFAGNDEAVRLLRLAGADDRTTWIPSPFDD